MISHYFASISLRQRQNNEVLSLGHAKRVLVVFKPHESYFETKEICIKMKFYFFFCCEYAVGFCVRYIETLFVSAKRVGAMKYISR